MAKRVPPYLALFVGLLCLPAASVDYLKIGPLPGNNVVGENVGCVRPAGGGVQTTTEQFVAIGWETGPNGIAEDGGGDDVEVGPVAATWSWQLMEVNPAYGNPDRSDVGSIDPQTGLFTAANLGISARGIVIASFPGATGATVSIYIFVPDFVQDPPRPVFAIECEVAGSDVTLTWMNNEAYDSIVISRGGAGIASIAGDATSFIDGGVPPGVHTYTIQGEIGGEVSVERICIAGVGLDQPIQLIWLPREGSPGGDATVAALSTALGALGVPHAVVSELIGLELTDYSLVWATLGLLFPDKHLLKPWEGEKLAKYLEAGGRVYIEGGDVWSDPPTRFHELAGVETTAIFTGSVNTLTGVGMGDCDFASFGASYSGDDFQVDRIGPAAPTAFEIWHRNTSIDAIGVYSETVGTPGRVIATTWFLGGYDGDTTALVAAYLDCLEPVTGSTDFRRGDVNGDGMFTLPDPLLGLNHLFLSVPIPCKDALDIDDNEQNSLPDPLALLNYLFLSAPPPEAPFPDCGPDPAGDALGCRSGGCP